MTEEQAATYTKLSEAMRAGARLRPQSDSCWDKTGTCAIGAAYHAVFGPTPDEQYLMTAAAVYKLQSVGLWPKDLDPTTIWRMNDHNRKSREQVADWLEHQGL